MRHLEFYAYEGGRGNRSSSESRPAVRPRANHAGHGVGWRFTPRLTALGLYGSCIRHQEIRVIRVTFDLQAFTKLGAARRPAAVALRRARIKCDSY